MSDEILTDAELAERWKLEGTPQAIAKKLQRQRALPKSNPRHLKSFTVGNQRRYRLEDVQAWEQRNATNFNFSLSNFSDSESAEWARLARLAGLIEED
jgi:hypothetical protein